MGLFRFRTLAAVLALSFAGDGTARAFELRTMEAAPTMLEAYVGGGLWSLVQLWTTDCVPCEQQKPMLEQFHVAHSDRDARVLGVALDGPEAIDAIEVIVARHEASYETLVALDDRFDRQFEELTGTEFRATPTYLLFTPDGAFAGAHVGLLSRGALEKIVAR